MAEHLGRHRSTLYGEVKGNHSVRRWTLLASHGGVKTRLMRSKLKLTFIRRFAYRVALTAFIAVWIITFAIRTYPVFFRPTCYKSTALIKLEGATSNLDLMQRQVEVICSPAILNPVIEQLDLNKFWVECFGLPFGFQIKTPELWEILKNQLNVTVVYSSPLIKIESYSEKATEAALIANGVAEAYRNFMVKNQKQIQVQIVDRAQPAL
jgi:capsular polysaccharide biosynthesis protein